MREGGALTATAEEPYGWWYAPRIFLTLHKRSAQLGAAHRRKGLKES